ncbi:50S ribosomal protein L21, chloroplastic [Glycine soja]
MSDKYGNVVERFLQFSELNAPSLCGKFFCPCVKCGNGRHQSINDIRSHLICDGIIPNYTKWIWHRELPDMPTISHTELVDVDIRHHIEDMIRDLGQGGFQQAHGLLYEKIENNSKKPLYYGCTTFTRLPAVLVLVNLKVGFDWSDKIFIELLVLLKKLLPKDSTLPKNQYEAKKILCPVEMEYQKIMHVQIIAYCTKISLHENVRNFEVLWNFNFICRNICWERQIALHKVLLVATNTFCYIGKPIVTNVVVYAIVEEQGLDPKVIVFKYKKKKHYPRNIGHRQGARVNMFLARNKSLLISRYKLYNKRAFHALRILTAFANAFHALQPLKVPTFMLGYSTCDSYSAVLWFSLTIMEFSIATNVPSVKASPLDPFPSGPDDEYYHQQQHYHYCHLDDLLHRSHLLELENFLGFPPN